MVILCPGIHDVCSTGGLEEGGSIMGNKNLNITDCKHYWHCINATVAYFK
jgi:hypothetical protein